tara:strand:+ start:531 stop:779 length:249 start_codon:yes stop_codon:yes gene_type:complete
MKYFIAFYTAAWIISMMKLYYPSIKTLKEVESNSVLVRNQFLGWMVAAPAFAIGTPLLFPISLSNRATKEFIVAFCDKALEK